jgi:hypothetical protein
VRLGVDDKGMVSTVRYDVDEADETPAAVAGSDPAQTVWTDSIPPADLGVAAMGMDEFNHLRVGQRAAPAVRDAVGDELWWNSGRSQEQSDYPAPSLPPRRHSRTLAQGGETTRGLSALEREPDAERGQHRSRYGVDQATNGGAPQERTDLGDQ